MSIVNKVALESEVLIEIWYYMLLYGNCSGKRTISWIERWAGTGRESTCQKAMDKLIIWGRGIDQEWDDYKWWYISLNWCIMLYHDVSWCIITEHHAVFFVLNVNVGTQRSRYQELNSHLYSYDCIFCSWIWWKHPCLGRWDQKGSSL